MGLSCGVAFVGAGNMAREHARAFADIPGVELRGIFSRTRQHAEKLAGEAGILRVCGSVAELYAATRADLVVVAVPELAANEVSRACFEHPWTVFLEKPAGNDLSDAGDIQRHAQRHGRHVLVGLNRRFLGSAGAAAADLSADPGVRFIHVHDQQDLALARSLGHPEQVVRNWMYANSIHVIDLLRWFGRGKVVAVEPVMPWRFPEPPQVVLARVEFDSGDTGLYEGVWQGPGPWAITVGTPSRRWELRPLEQAALQLAGEREVRPAEPRAWDAEFKPGFRAQAEMAVAAALGQPSASPTLDDAMETMRLIQRIFSP